MATFEILVELVCIDANQEASSMVKVNMNTNPASTEMESWLEVGQCASLGLASLDQETLGYAQCRL